MTRQSSTKLIVVRKLLDFPFKRKEICISIKQRSQSVSLQPSLAHSWVTHIVFGKQLSQHLHWRGFHTNI